MDDSERFSRQQDIVPQKRLAALKITIIGVGAIGRQLALQLAAMGIKRLQLVDFDEVEPTNLASQGFLEKDLGHLKVEAVASLCRELNRKIVIDCLPERFRRSRPVGNAVFCCVDRIESRKQVWEAVRHRCDFFCDGRMAAEVLRVVTVSDANSRWCYESTLFNSAEAYIGPCTAKTTIYCANIASGLMASQFAKWLRRLPIDFDCQLNLLADELAVFLPTVTPHTNHHSNGGETQNDRPPLREPDESVSLV